MADVGRVAGVSPTTVSFVLNERPGMRISAETQSRVLNAVQQLGYRPNRAARVLRTKRTQTVGFVTDEVAVDPFAGRAILGVHDVAWQHGSLLLVANTTRDQRRLRASVEDLLDRQVDAIVFAVVGTRRVVLPEAIGTVPTVLVNCFVAGDTLPCVLPDEEAGGQDAAELLLTAGHRRIGYVTGLPSSWATRRRLKGFRTALRRADVAYDERLVLPGDFHTDSGYQRTRELLAGALRPSGILYGNDRMALGGYLALAEAGLRVPQDVSVVGYDDQVDLAAKIHPPLSTVRLPYYEMGWWAAEQLLSGKVEHLAPRTHLPCPVRARASVGPPRS